MTATLDDMPVPPAAPQPRRLRRSRTGRVGAGVAAGLGDYFGLDPVLFRVLFATSAFFGGAGILAYLLAWAAIPEDGTGRAPVDGWVAALRRRRVPLWLVAIVGAVLLWSVAFSWWAPGPFAPVLIVLGAIVFLLVRRDLRTPSRPLVDDPGATLSADDAGTGTAPPWAGEARTWFRDARAAARVRRRRALPVRLATLLALVLALATLGVVDAVAGVQVQAYFWTALGVLGLGLLVGLVTRRTPLSVVPLLLASVAGAVAFAGSHARLHDGAGQREWTPTTAPAGSYRLAFGRAVLDLRSLDPQSSPRRIDVTVGAGRVLVIAPKSLPMTVLANVHFGEVLTPVNGVETDADRVGGAGVSHTVEPLAEASGQPVLVDIHLADGTITVDRR